MNLIKTLTYLTTFIGIVGYLETGKTIYSIAFASGIVVIGIIKINFKK